MLKCRSQKRQADWDDRRESKARAVDEEKREVTLKRIIQETVETRLRIEAVRSWAREHGLTPPEPLSDEERAEARRVMEAFARGEEVEGTKLVLQPAAKAAELTTAPRPTNTRVKRGADDEGEAKVKREAEVKREPGVKRGAEVKREETDEAEDAKSFAAVKYEAGQSSTPAIQRVATEVETAVDAVVKAEEVIVKTEE
jgi:hypothetical protein